MEGFSILESSVIQRIFHRVAPVSYELFREDINLMLASGIFMYVRYANIVELTDIQAETQYIVKIFANGALTENGYMFLHFTSLKWFKLPRTFQFKLPSMDNNNKQLNILFYADVDAGIKSKPTYDRLRAEVKTIYFKSCH